MFGKATVVRMGRLLLLISVQVCASPISTDLLGMDLLDPDLGDGPASHLLYSFKGITEPLFLSLVVVDSDLDLAFSLCWFPPLHLAFRP